MSSGPAEANAAWLLTLLELRLFFWRAEAELVNNRYNLNCDVPLPCKFGPYSQCQYNAWTTYYGTCTSVLSFYLCYWMLKHNHKHWLQCHVPGTEPWLHLIMVLTTLATWFKDLPWGISTSVVDVLYAVYNTDKKKLALPIVLIWMPQVW